MLSTTRSDMCLNGLGIIIFELLTLSSLKTIRNFENIIFMSLWYMFHVIEEVDFNAGMALSAFRA